MTWLSDFKVFALYCWRRLKHALAHSQWGYCLRCGREWNSTQRADRHETFFGRKLPGSKGAYGVFPLCEACWMELGTAERRLPFYRRLHRKWMKNGMTGEGAQWELMEAAVRRESAE